MNAPATIETLRFEQVTGAGGAVVHGVPLSGPADEATRQAERAIAAATAPTEAVAPGDEMPAAAEPQAEPAVLAPAASAVSGRRRARPCLRGHGTGGT